MKTQIVKSLSIVSILFGFLAVTSLHASANALDGKTFTGTAGKKGEKADPDTLIFKHGMLHSTACDQFGFKEGRYVTTQKDGVINFTAITMNDTGAKMKWAGTVKDGKLEGTAHWTKKGEKPMDMVIVATETASNPNNSGFEKGAVKKK